MNNFKSNNRFNFLNENETADKNGNSKRDSFSKKDFDNKPKYQTYNKFKSDEKYIPQKKEFQMKENEFPELLTSNLEKKSDTIEQALVSSSWISYKVDHTQFKLNETFTFSYINIILSQLKNIFNYKIFKLIKITKKFKKNS